MTAHEDERQYCFAPLTHACINCIQFEKDGMFCRLGFKRFIVPDEKTLIEPSPATIKEPKSRW